MTSAHRTGREALLQDHLSDALLRSLREPVVVLDGNGIVVACNEAWCSLARECSAAEVGPGDDLLVRYRAAVSAGSVPPGLVSGIESVLNGSREEFTLELSCPLLEPRWFLATVVPLKGPQTGAVMSYTDLTGRKQAEEESRRIHEELTHVARVSMMGELLASLAHELNQPLTAILSNAQAALRFLAAPKLDLAEVRAALMDIVKDERWAAEVIQRLRKFVRRGNAERALLDLNEVLHATFQLMRTEAMERGVVVKLDLAPSLPLVLGDRVQLQQVVLNLVLNAFEAMAESTERRNLRIQTREDGGVVTVSVQDSGSGLDDADLERIFDAFYTTKSEGLGIGLSISLSIVEAHGGRLWAVRNADRGMTFHVSLPVAA